MRARRVTISARAPDPVTARARPGPCPGGREKAMTRRMAVIMVSLTMLATYSWADDVHARAGRASAAGTRASRSYSAAPRPSPRPAPPAAAASRGARRDGPRLEEAAARLGDWTNGAAGFLSGGLLGGWLLGGGGGPGMGPLDALALGALGYLALSLLRTRAPRPAHLAAAYGLGGDGRGSPPRQGRAHPGEPAALGGPVRRADRAFDQQALVETAATAFEQVQHAWAARDAGPIAALLTPDMQASFWRECDQMAGRGRRNRVDGVSVDDTEVVQTWQENGLDWATVRVEATVLDYTVDERTGQIVEGDASAPTPVAEIWTFTRPVWAKGWRVSAIQQAARGARRRPAAATPR
jgi:predicted lipid-binding transport protein (Tim44 family)